MKTLSIYIALFLTTAGSNAWGATAYFSEPAGGIRFEQYTPGPMAMWRMPNPGSSKFPGGNCTALTITGGDTTMNRFLSLYLFLKANGGTYFVGYDTVTCSTISFGTDG